MEFGALFLGDPPVSRVVDLAKKAEDLGFDYVWLADSQVLWQEAWVTFALMAEATETIKIGPCVTNPATRDPSVLASLLGTLDEVSGGRMVCGIGRGDSAVRTVGRRPATVAQFEESIKIIQELVGGRSVEINGQEVSFPWIEGREIEMWGAGYGPRALGVVGGTCDGYILQLTDPDILEWIQPAVDRGAVAAGRDPADVRTMVSGPAYITDDTNRAHAHDQLRWFAGSVANHVADLIDAHGTGTFPKSLTEFMTGRPKYDYQQHGKVGNPSTDYIDDEVNERFCVIGTPEEHIEKLGVLEDRGADLYTIYFIHDNIEATMEAYGKHVIPALRG